MVKNFHYCASALLILLLLPLLRLTHILFRYNIKVFGLTYLMVGIQSIFLALLLYLLLTPLQAFDSFLKPLHRDHVRILLLVAYFVVLIWILPIPKAILAVLVTISFLEILQSRKSSIHRKKIVAFIKASSYLLLGLILVASYNDIILSAQKNVDNLLLHGKSISMASHWAVRTFSMPFFNFLEFIYYGLFAVIGVGLIFSVIGYTPDRGMRFVGTILTCYYLTLVIFYFWPSLGPYYLCPTHFGLFPRELETYVLQKQSIKGALALWNGVPLSTISFEYYIAFPCMHITQSIIVLWFLRRWKPIFILLLAYNALLISAIIFLEWHYLVDILAGIAIAAIAIIAVDVSLLDEKPDPEISISSPHSPEPITYRA
jgi:hypothetical protein